MNIVILSGGTGSVALQKGLKHYYPEAKITNLINAYDDGKSTGVARRVMNCLGPSDIRKNQYTQYLNTVKKPEVWLEAMFTWRLDIDKSGPLEFCKLFMDKIGVPGAQRITYDILVEHFFRTNSAWAEEDLTDFSIANILYAAGFDLWGYKATIQYWMHTLEIQDDIVLNSETNSFLTAITTSGKILKSEGAIVDHADADDRIVSVMFDKEPAVCLEALSCIEKADMIVISSGTQFASLIPTYMTRGISEAINGTDCPKYLVMNNKPDNDMLGWTGNEVVDEISKHLDLKNIMILNNLDVNSNMWATKTSKSIFQSLGDNDGKHDGCLLANAIFTDYFCLESAKLSLEQESAILACDLDGTVYSEGEEASNEDNFKLLEELSYKNFTCILSGNDHTHVSDVASEYGSSPVSTNINLMGDYGNVWFDEEGLPFVWSRDAILTRSDIQMINNFARQHLTADHGPNVKTCQSSKIKINYRNIHDKNRAELVSTYNLVINDLNFDGKLVPKAVKAGKTSIDFVRIDKAYVLTTLQEELDKMDIIYIGDEMFGGNDTFALSSCEYPIPVNCVQDTTCILKIFNGD